jgi:hypothetical protein
MKTFTHVVLPIGIVVVLVGVVAYVTSYTSRPPTTNTTPTDPEGPIVIPVERHIIFDDPLVSDDPKTILVEYKSKNNRKDFWFHNPLAQPVQICVKYKSCTCSELKIGTVGLTDAEWDALLKYPSLTGWCKLAESVTFAPLPDKDNKEKARISVLPAKPYLLRLEWEAKKQPYEVEPDSLRVEVQAEVPNGAINYYERRVSFSVRPVIEFYPLKVDVGDVVADGSRSVEFFVWSETRDQLRIRPRVIARGENSPDEPCGEISVPIEMPPKQLFEILGPWEQAFASLRIKCGYRLTVTVHERRGDKQLEMGPLERMINFAFDTDSGETKIDDVKIPLIGLVKGEVRLLNGDDQDRIKLGAYKYDRGKKTTAILGANDPRVELELEKTTSPKLKARLLDPELIDGRRQWKLEVEMEPNAMLGELGASVIITLRTKGPNPRLLRLPVSGRAER